MQATFAAGCFWHVEEAFRHLKGVKLTIVGYTGGTSKNPKYQSVCSGATGHAEAIRVEYDHAKILYKKLLKIFWDCHDPTQINKQGPDIGTQYRSAIFYHNEQQKNEAEASLKEEQKKYKQKIATQILPAQEFYKAEEYHQRYLEKHGGSACPA